MKTKITKYAAAAVIIIAVMIGINQFGGSSVVWADVANKIEQISSYVYRLQQMSSSGPKKEGFEFATKSETTVYNSFKHGIKIGGPEGPAGIYLQRKNGIILWVEPTEKLYTRDPLNELKLLTILKGPREIVTRFLSTAYTELGGKTIDGVEAEGIEGNDPNVLPKGFVVEGPIYIPSVGSVGEDFIARLWVNPKTQLPVSLELEYVLKDTKHRGRIVIDQFRWNVELNADMFEPNIPADYALWVPPEYEKSVAVEVQEEPLVELSEIQGLNLLGLEDTDPIDFTTLIGYEEIWRKQEEIMRTWPDYSEVRDQLYDELVSKLDINELSEKQIVSTAVALRELFWEKGGCLSETSYPYGYAARMLLEIAHEQDPKNMAITDELVESIQSIQVRTVYSPDSDGSVLGFAINKKFYEVLPQLRWTQFEQIKKELVDGREPDWEDFVRVNDLAAILSRTEDFENGIAVVEWLISQISRDGFWSTYLPLFERVLNDFKKAERSGWRIYTHPPDLFPEVYRYSRRLPSFKGPAKYRRHLIPCHVRNRNYFGGKRVNK